MTEPGKIAEITGAKTLSLITEHPVYHLLLDSRRIISPSGSLFFAIKGVRHDGHIFLPMLYARGVRNFIIEDLSSIDLASFPEANIWHAQSSVDVLQKLVAFHRRAFTVPVIGITGSNGKTIVKEWLSQVLSQDFSIVKNPKSFNSQVGVPLSVWEMNSRHTLGIFEAGISLPGEMEKLEKVIQPDIGIITNIGPAHDKGFSSRDEKTSEKLKLFRNCKLLFYRKDYPEIEKHIREFRGETFSWSNRRDADVEVLRTQTSGTGTSISLSYKNALYHFVLPFTDEASLENIMFCICVMLHYRKGSEEIQSRINQLQPVAMRLELKEGINGCYLIDDTYNNDLSGLAMAVNFLDQQKQKQKKCVILSDMLESGIEPSSLYAQIARLMKEKGVSKIIGIGQEISGHRAEFAGLDATFYNSTEEFLIKHDTATFSDEIVLIKGARVFEFEKLVQRLQQKMHGTVLEINLDALAHNLNFYRSRLNPGTRIMVMVKAFAYGSGSFEVANLLQFHRADYLAVAYADEGVALRENGITMPVMVMNPSYQTFDKIIRYHLEPEIYSFQILKEFVQYLKEHNTTSVVHLKFDTGMRRLGFEEKDLPQLITLLKTSGLTVASLFTHLAAADEEVHNSFTLEQMEKFTRMADIVEHNLGYKPLRHALNSAGIVRFPEHQMNMVRLGIGLYGVEANGIRQQELESVGTLKTIISQIKHVEAGESVGYSRKGKATHPTTIATIAIGYADGYDRRFSNGKGKVLVKGKLCPVIGNVCMDMCMIDITGVDAKEGDEVIVFGKGISIIDMAKEIGTIPYEILTGIGERVKRVFYAES